MEHGARRDDDSQWRHSLSPPLPTMDRSPLPEDMQHRLCPSPSHDPLRIAESRSPLPYKEEVVMDAQRIFSPTITIDTHGRSPVHPCSDGERIRPTQARKLTLLRLGGSSSAGASRMGGRPKPSSSRVGSSAAASLKSALHGRSYFPKEATTLRWSSTQAPTR
jgi:hypothetical protein